MKSDRAAGGPRRAALAYSGGLDTSIIIPWLADHHGCEVVAVVADVGQEDDFEAVREKALSTGAVECRVVDLRDRFAEEMLLPAIRAGAVYEGRYLLGTALARPLIAEAQVAVARETGCDALAHGCTGKGNDQVRFEATYGALAPELPVIAPWREWAIRSREDAIAYARAQGIPVPVTPEKPYSVDENLWHTSYEGGVLEDPSREAPGGLCRMTADPEEAPDEPARIEIGFEAGVPIRLAGERRSPRELIAELNRRAGRHGVGRADIVENRVVGMKSRGVYETPAGTVLREALRDLEAVTLDRDVQRFKEGVAGRYADLVYEGRWHSPLRSALDAFLAEACAAVTGRVTVELYKGACRAVSREAERPLYDESLASFGAGGAYDHADAEGFIRLWTLPTRVQARARGGSDGESSAARRRSGEDASSREGASGPSGGASGPVDRGVGATEETLTGPAARA